MWGLQNLYPWATPLSQVSWLHTWIVVGFLVGFSCVCFYQHQNIPEIFLPSEKLGLMVRPSSCSSVSVSCLTKWQPPPPGASQNPDVHIPLLCLYPPYPAGSHTLLFLSAQYILGLSLPFIHMVRVLVPGATFSLNSCHSLRAGFLVSMTHYL